MQFTEKQIHELKTLCRDDGVDLTQQEALDLARWLVSRVRSVAYSIPSEDQEEFERIAHDTRSTNS